MNTREFDEHWAMELLQDFEREFLSNVDDRFVHEDEDTGYFPEETEYDNDSA